QSGIYENAFVGPGIKNVSLGSHPLDEPRTKFSRIHVVNPDQNKIETQYVQ
ncbi:11805_t:CDS:1, partial [Gigaspora margarita]